MAVQIDRDLVLHVARLARLELGEDEIARLTEQMGEMVAYVELLGEADTSGREATTHVRELPTPLRPDETRPSLANEDALANAPDRSDPFFRVPRVIE